MGMYKYISKFWQDSKEQKGVLRERMISWRRQPVIVTVDKPTRIDKARMLGYKAKQGFVIARVRVHKGGRKRPAIARGRKPSRYGLVHYSVSLQAVAEQRVARKYPNLEVLNSYYASDDSKYVWYEVILVDKSHPAIKSDKDIGWIVNHRRRVFRGLTSTVTHSKNSNRRA